MAEDRGSGWGEINDGVLASALVERIFQHLV